MVEGISGKSPVFGGYKGKVPKFTVIEDKYELHLKLNPNKAKSKPHVDDPCTQTCRPPEPKDLSLPTTPNKPVASEAGQNPGLTLVVSPHEVYIPQPELFNLGEREPKPNKPAAPSKEGWYKPIDYTPYIGYKGYKPSIPVKPKAAEPKPHVDDPSNQDDTAQ